MRITLLGTGTSTGVPVIGCQCKTCCSNDPRDKRLRVSALIETNGLTILIDCGPDFRQQALRHNISKLDAILYTHLHVDHVAGFDDLRAFQFIGVKPPTCYADKKTTETITQMFPFAFGIKPNTGGATLEQIPFVLIDGSPFEINGVQVRPIPIDHGILDIYGFRIDNFAYITDCKRIPVASKEKLKGLDVLVLDALRYRSHPTHQTIDEAIAVVKELAPKQTYFTHMTHDVLHAEAEAVLPPSMHLGYDGMIIETARS